MQGEETAVRYWQDIIKSLVNQYLLEFPNGVKSTYKYTHLPTNFGMNSMLGGLCNICDDFEYSDFDDLCTFIDEICSLCPGVNGLMLIKHVMCGRIQWFRPVMSSPQGYFDFFWFPKVIEYVKYKK